MGPRSSALVCGWTGEHRALELEIARLKGTEDCLLFPTGARRGRAPGAPARRRRAGGGVPAAAGPGVGGRAHSCDEPAA
jgi:hypothetical protein